MEMSLKWTLMTILQPAAVLSCNVKNTWPDVQYNTNAIYIH